MNGNRTHFSQPLPVTFNPYKHHIGFLRMKILEWKKTDWNIVEQEIRLIGNNLIDLYFGCLTINDIYEQVYKFTMETNITSSDKLTQWLYPMDYKKTVLSDSSVWVIKLGDDLMHYLHIHPAKYSPYTIRVKAPTLKTVIALQVLNFDNQICDLATVNKIRIEKLNLSPVKGLIPGKGIARLMASFNSL